MMTKISPGFMRRFLLAALVTLVSSTAWAQQTDTDTFNVTVEVLSSCTVSADNLDFGTYDGAQLDATSDITVNCTGTTPYTVEIDGGEANDTAVRVMTGDTVGTATLRYDLYSDTQGGTLFTEGAANDVDGVGTGADQTVTVYGRMPASQLLIEDTYTDTVTVSVSY